LGVTPRIIRDGEMKGLIPQFAMLLGQITELAAEMRESLT
jgi:hypothetical protein